MVSDKTLRKSIFGIERGDKPDFTMARFLHLEGWERMGILACPPPCRWMLGTKATRIATMGKQFRSAIEGLKSFESWQEGS